MNAPPLARRADPAALRPQPKRDGPDYWATPPCLLRALVLDVLPALPPGRVWEPAAGQGAIVGALRAAGREVIATDVYAGTPEARRDFLTDPAQCWYCMLPL